MTSYNASCHCGAVKITLNHKPGYINDCNCSLCSKAGGIWGYYDPLEVSVSGKTHTYQRIDYPNPAVEIHFCKTCGSTTHWRLTAKYKQTSDAAEQMGVNMRLFDEEELAGIELRFPDGKAWFGDGEFGYRKESIIIGSKAL